MPQESSLPIIALTQGDPAGIGPELCLKVIREPRVLAVCRPVIIGAREVLKRVAKKLDLILPEEIYGPTALEEPGLLTGGGPPALVNLDVLASEIEPGIATWEAGIVSCCYIRLAANAATAGIVQAMVTAPITKKTLELAKARMDPYEITYEGVTYDPAELLGFPGHTEILAHLTGCENYAMMLYSERMAVSLVTIHQSLASVSGDLKTEEIVRVTKLTAETMRRIRGREPRLAILGLNPHAGEDGMFGREEIEIIAPAVELARNAGIDVEGPLSPDAAFMPHNLARFDAHVCMYHDQGLIPFKMISLHDGVNITMGLPIVRTSVDHGTAYNIAWQGKAETTSFISAIELAAKLSLK